MHYFGGKVRIAGTIVKELQKMLGTDQTFVDLFCGSCNIVSKISAKKRIANDAHKELIALHKAVQNGWIPPDIVSEEDYTNAKTAEDHLKAFVGFGCSFSGKWFGGYARDGSDRNYAKNAKNSLLKKHRTMQDVLFLNLSYEKVNLPNNSLVYCDIPYKNTTGYSVGSFNHDDFYAWAKNMKEKGQSIIVSEYSCNVPADWQVVFELESKKDIRNKDGIQEKTTEILMIP